MKAATFTDWPAESIERMLAILSDLERKVTRIESAVIPIIPASVQMDADYLASLSPAERKAKLKEERNGRKV